MSALKMRNAVARHEKLTTTSWDDHWGWSSYKYMRSYWRTQCQPSCGSSAFEGNWKGEKLSKWVPCELTKNKNCRFEVLSSLILCNNRPFLYWIVMCNKRWILFNKHWWWPAQWLEWEEDPKHFSMPNLHQKKKKGYGHCLVICCPSDPQQLSESWWNHYIWEVCSANRWDTLKIAMPTAGIGPQKGPSSFLQQHLTTCHVTKASKVE